MLHACKAFKTSFRVQRLIHKCFNRSAVSFFMPLLEEITFTSFVPSRGLPSRYELQSYEPSLCELQASPHKRAVYFRACTSSRDIERFWLQMSREGGGGCTGRINLFSFYFAILFNYFSFLPLFACCFARYFNVSHPPTHNACQNRKGLVGRAKMPASSPLAWTSSKRHRIEGKHRLKRYRRWPDRRVTSQVRSYETVRSKNT